MRKDQHPNLHVLHIVCMRIVMKWCWLRWLKGFISEFVVILRFLRFPQKVISITGETTLLPFSNFDVEFRS